MYTMWCSLCVRGVLYMACICTLLGTPCVHTVLWTWPVCYGVLLVCTQYSVHGLCIMAGYSLCVHGILYIVGYSLCVHGTLYLYMAFTLWGSPSLLCVHGLYVTEYSFLCVHGILYSCMAYTLWETSCSVCVCVCIIARRILYSIQLHCL